ncbi:MAG: hypothetical protein R3Y64_08815 [Peptostreptococcaceae bacterium]
MKRIILTDRDKQIIQFLKDFKVADTNTLANIFFNGSARPTQRRLKHLTEHGYIKNFQENINLHKIHYVNKKPIQIKHNLILSSFITELKKLDIEIIKYKVPYKFKNIIADMFICFKYRNSTYIYFVEVENTKKFDLDKYLKLFDSGEYKEVFPVMPPILVISNKTVPKEINKLTIVDVKTDFSNIENFIFNL